MGMVPNRGEPGPAQLDRLRKILDVSDDAILCFDREGRLCDYNASVGRLLGYDDAELSELTVSDLFCAGGAEAALVFDLADPREAARMCDVRWRRKDGSELLTVLKVLALDDDGERVTIIARDVTEQRRFDEQLRLFESVVTNTNDAVVITDPNVGSALGPTILYVNDAFTEVTGYTRDEVMGLSPRILYGPDTDPKTLAHIRDQLAERKPVRVELVNYAKDGRAYWVDLSMVPALDELGAVTHLIAVEREITARKLAEFMEFDQRTVLEMIARGAELSDVLLQVITMVERQGGDLQGALVMRAGGSLRHLLAPRVSMGVVDAVDSGRVGTGLSWMGEVLQEGGPRWEVHLAESPHWRQLRSIAGASAPHAVWAVPLSEAGGEGGGLLVAYCATARAPSDSELAVLETAARLAAIGMEHRQLSERLIHQAQHDALTQLPNRYLFEDRLNAALAECAPDGEHVALLCVDLDRFKQINDTLGHAVGDELLVSVARRLAACTRSSDTLARMGGDEFVLILSHLREAAVAMDVADRLIAAMKEPFVIQGYELVVTTSIGIGIYPQDGEDARTLLKNADSALYHAKTSGRNVFKCFSPRMNAMTLELLELENELRRALDRNELLLHYQPQIDLKTMEVVGCEALVRWQHHKLGMVPPGDFIPLAEEVGMIVPIGAWVLEEACRQKVRWEAQGLKGLKVSVNVSALQLGQDDFVAQVARALESTGIEDGGWLDLEVTETLLAQDVDQFAQRLAQVRNLGVTVSIDDFGIGYSSLARLQQLPIDTLKIDHSFTRSIGEKDGKPTGDGMALVRTVVTLAHNLGVEVVAEGVETPVQLAFLQELDCDKAQGYLLSRPIPADELLARFGDCAAVKLAS